MIKCFLILRRQNRMFVNDKIILDTRKEQEALKGALNHYSQLEKVHKWDLQQRLEVIDNEDGTRDYTYEGDVVLRVGEKNKV